MDGLFLAMEHICTVGYDESMLAETPHDYMMFQIPYGVLFLKKLPMGWTNKVPVFHNDIMHILQLEVAQFIIPYIDNVPIHGPMTTYQSNDGAFKTIPKNSRICHFIWEHFQNLNCIVQHMKYCEGAFLGKKSPLCAYGITVVGHICTPKGCIPDPTRGGSTRSLIGALAWTSQKFACSLAL